MLAATLCAPEGGHVFCRRFLHETGCAFDNGCALAAAQNEFPTALEYLLDNGSPVTGEACAAVAGHVECVRILDEHGLHVATNDCRNAAADGGSVDTLAYLFERGCSLTPDVATRAAAGGSIDCLQFLRNNSCDLDLDLHQRCRIQPPLQNTRLSA
eukprot:m.106996 g.106996  ORF g.106996 m.106996 type:complete len:156 (+) comp15816_c0_seq1:657-1124(+)